MAAASLQGARSVAWLGFQSKWVIPHAHVLASKLPLRYLDLR